MAPAPPPISNNTEWDASSHLRIAQHDHMQESYGQAYPVGSMVPNRSSTVTPSSRRGRGARCATSAGSATTKPVADPTPIEERGASGAGTPGRLAPEATEGSPRMQGHRSAPRGVCGDGRGPLASLASRDGWDRGRPEHRDRAGDVRGRRGAAAGAAGRAPRGDRSPATDPRQLSPACAELQRLARHGVRSGRAGGAPGRRARTRPAARTVAPGPGLQFRNPAAQQAELVALRILEDVPRLLTGLAHVRRAGTQ
jgi:hypothetical protein